MPETSVIIPTYNSSSYIVKAIESVLSQTYLDYEIIIVDDGSTDNTKEILEKFCSNKIRYFKIENGGPGAARNFGIDKAFGKYLAFLDADDTWIPEKLEKSIACLNNDSNLVMVYSDVDIIDINGKLLKTWLKDKKYKCECDIYEALLKECFILTSSVVVKKEAVLMARGFREDLSYCEDYALWIKLSKMGSVICLKESLVKHLKHDSNLTSNIYLKSRDGAIFCRELCDIAGEVGGDTLKIVRKNASADLFDYGFCLFGNGETIKSRSVFSESIVLNPKFKLAWVYYFVSFIPIVLIKFIKKIKKKL